MAIELIKIIPSFLWFSLVLVILVLFYRPIRENLLPNLASLKAGGVELSFVKDSIDAALKMADKSPQWQVEVSPADKERALKRAQKHLKVFNNAQFLWVDDHPENNLNERAMFRRLRVEVDTAKTTEEAVSMLENANYDVVISDMERNGDHAAGISFLEQLAEKEKVVPVVFYVGVFNPQLGVPARAFGITNRPSELLHLTLDVLERCKY